MKKNEEREERKSRKILVPLATLAVASAVAVGSGATWTSTSISTVTVTGGNIKQINDRPTLTVTDIKPGDTVTGSVTITNNGKLPAILDVEETSDYTEFTAPNLQLTVTRAGDATPLYNGDFGGWSGKTVLDANFVQTETTTLNFAVTLDQDAPNSEQDKTANASFTFTTTQQNGDPNRSFS